MEDALRERLRGRERELCFHSFTKRRRRLRDLRLADAPVAVEGGLDAADGRAAVRVAALRVGVDEFRPLLQHPDHDGQNGAERVVGLRRELLAGDRRPDDAQIHPEILAHDVRPAREMLVIRPHVLVVVRDVLAAALDVDDVRPQSRRSRHHLWMLGHHRQKLISIQLLRAAHHPRHVLVRRLRQAHRFHGAHELVGFDGPGSVGIEAGKGRDGVALRDARQHVHVAARLERRADVLDERRVEDLREGDRQDHAQKDQQQPLEANVLGLGRAELAKLGRALGRHVVPHASVAHDLLAREARDELGVERLLRLAVPLELGAVTEADGVREPKGDGLAEHDHQQREEERHAAPRPRVRRHVRAQDLAPRVILPEHAARPGEGVAELLDEARHALGDELFER
mmetsp:Transcript_2369/g.7846  ORF Transcript_2369/g.7846 Transcript_2369/m.7846 type:complete len:399 (-) Transcript_2369:1457-2653(-)